MLCPKCKRQTKRHVKDGAVWNLCDNRRCEWYGRKIGAPLVLPKQDPNGDHSQEEMTYSQE